MRKRNEELHNDPWDRDFYETGSTKPPKNRGGVVAVALVAVIASVSMIRAMGIINVHHLRQLVEEKQAQSVNLFESQQGQPLPDQTEPTQTQPPEMEFITEALHLQGVTVSTFDREYYSLPQGYLVTQVQEDGCAQRGGMCSGDVIIRLEGQAVCSGAELLALLEQCAPGDSVTVEVYRSKTGREHTLTLALEERG